MSKNWGQNVNSTQSLFHHQTTTLNINKENDHKLMKAKIFMQWITLTLWPVNSHQIHLYMFHVKCLKQGQSSCAHVEYIFNFNFNNEQYTDDIKNRTQKQVVCTTNFSRTFGKKKISNKTLLHILFKWWENLLSTLATISYWVKHWNINWQHFQSEQMITFADKELQRMLFNDLLQCRLCKLLKLLTFIILLFCMKNV